MFLHEIGITADDMHVINMKRKQLTRSLLPFVAINYVCLSASWFSSIAVIYAHRIGL